MCECFPNNDEQFIDGVSINQLKYIEDIEAENMLRDLVASGQIEEPEDCGFYWGIVDELKAKKREWNKKHNPLYKKYYG